MSKTQTPQEPIHSRKIKVLAEVQLDDEQKIATGHSLVDEMAVRDRKEDDFKVMREFHKGEIKALDTRIMELRSEINTGRGTREIEAEEFFFWDLGKVKTQRTDNGDVVSERPLYAAEKRLRLPIDEIPEEACEEQMTLVKMTPPQASPVAAEKPGPRRVVDPLADDDDFQVLDQNGDPE
jgi:hypothetical protein